MIKSNNLDITRIFYNNIDISDLYYNLKKYFKRCICDCSLGGEDPDLPDDPDIPIGDFGLYINTYNTRELMLDSLYTDDLYNRTSATLPQSLYKFTALDDCFVYNNIVPVGFMNFAHHDGLDSSWFIPLVFGNREVEYVDLYVDHNLVKRYTSLSKALNITGYAAGGVPLYWTVFGKICNGIDGTDYISSNNYVTDLIYGISVSYNDVVSAPKIFYNTYSFSNMTASGGSWETFKKSGYSTSFYKSADNGYTCRLWTAWTPVTINVKFKNNYTDVYIVFLTMNIFLYINESSLCIPALRLSSREPDYTISREPVLRHYILYPIKTKNVNVVTTLYDNYDGVWETRDLLTSFLFHTCPLTCYEKCLFVIPPHLSKVDLNIRTYWNISSYETDIFCFTERPQNINFTDDSTNANKKTINIYCKEQWKDNYVNTVNRLNTVNSNVKFNLKTF